MKKIFLIILMLVALTSSVQAQSNIKPSLSIKVNPELDGTILYSLSIKNKDSRDLLDEITATIPIGAPENISVRLNDKNLLPYELLGNEIKIKITGAKVLNTADIQIRYTSRNILTQSFGQYLLNLPASNNNLSSLAVNLEYPKNLGPVIHSSHRYKSTASNSSYQITFNRNRNSSVLLIGNTQSTIFSSDFQIPPQVQPGHLAVPIPQNTTNQTVTWGELGVPDKAIMDEVGNHYLLFDGSNTRSANYNGKVYTELRMPSTERFQIDSRYITSELPVFSTKKAGSEIAELISGYAKQRLAPSLSAQVTQHYFDYNQILSQNFHTPYNYCNLVIATANANSIPSRTVYGKMLNSFNSGIDTNVPYVWCELLIDDEVWVVDPYLDDLTGINFTSNFRIGKLFYGYYNPDSSINPLFGVLRTPDQLMAEYFSTSGPRNEVPFSAYQITNNTQITGSIFEPINYSTLIENTSNQMIPITEVVVNDTLLPTQYSRLLLPQRQNYIEIGNIVGASEKVLGETVYNVSIKTPNQEFIDNPVVSLHSGYDARNIVFIAFLSLAFILFIATMGLLYRLRH